MRRYSYRYAEGSAVIFGGHFDFEIRGSCALVLLADHLIPLAVSEIPTQIHRRFLSWLEPSNVLFVEFDTVADAYQLVDFRWTETAGGYRFVSAAPLTPPMVCALGLATPRWRRALDSVIGTAGDAARGAPSKV